MSMEAGMLGIPAALVMGLAFGAGPCNIACLPYLGPVFTAAGRENGGGGRVMVPFSLGRFTGYALLGMGAGWAGRALVERLENAPVHAVLGGATVLVGLSLFRRRSGGGAGCGARARRSGTRRGPAAYGSGLFLMGAGMALNPCLPLGTLLLAAAGSGSPLMGLALGAGFGAGAVVVPALVYGIGMAQVGEQLRRNLGELQNLERVSALLLISLGSATALGWVAP